MLIGYVRSTRLLASPYTQATRLIELGCEVIFIETSSGDHLARPVLHRAIEDLRPGDVLVVGDSDRLSRNELQLDILRRRIVERGAELRLLEPQGEVIDVDTANSTTDS